MTCAQRHDPGNHLTRCYTLLWRGNCEVRKIAARGLQCPSLPAKFCAAGPNIASPGAFTGAVRSEGPYRAVKAEPSDISVARLRLQAGQIDGPAVHARRCPRLQAVHLKSQAREDLGQPG